MQMLWVDLTTGSVRRRRSLAQVLGVQALEADRL